LEEGESHEEPQVRGGGSALVGIVSLFLKWVAIDGKPPAIIADALPTTGMGNGGPIFLIMLLLPIVAAAIGAAKRFGRGFAVMALVGALGAWLLAMVKLSDISHAGDELSKLGMGDGGDFSVSAASGYYVFLFATSIAALGSIVGLVKPEPKPAT
jgi:hypothetical protein